ncbi:MAG: MFS transporter [Actinomycetales bacterium]|nr:MFS transporter [Actinomycetales bacterium]
MFSRSFSRIAPDGNWRALRHRNFRILYGGAILTNIGTWAQRIAQDWLVLELTNNNGFYLGIVTALQFLPVMLLSMQGGVLADKVNKKKALIITNLGSAISALALGALVISNHVTMNYVYLLAVALGIFSAVDAPIRSSFIVEVVGKPDLTNAMGLNSANFHFGRLIGPTVSGFLIAGFGTGPSFIINGVSFLIIMFSFMAVRDDELHDQEIQETDGTLKEAFNYIKKRPDIQMIMITIFFAANFGLNAQIFNALMATKEFHKGAASYGILGTAIAVGTLTGALISARIDRTKRPMFVPLAAMNFSVWVLALAIAPTYLVYALLLPINGFSALTTMISANTYIQANSDHAIRGRIMGIYMFIFMGGTPLGSPLIGYCAEHFGPRATIAGCAAITFAAALFAYTKYRGEAKVPVDVSVSAILQTEQNK